MSLEDRSLEEIRSELADIAEELIAIPDDDFAARSELRSRQAMLRREAASRRPEIADVESMQRELEQLARRRRALLDARPNIAAMGDGGEGQTGMAENQEMVWAFDRGQGLPGIEARMEELTRMIEAARAAAD